MLPPGDWVEEDVYKQQTNKQIIIAPVQSWSVAPHPQVRKGSGSVKIHSVSRTDNALMFGRATAPGVLRPLGLCVSPSGLSAGRSISLCCAVTLQNQP